MRAGLRGAAGWLCATWLHGASAPAPGVVDRIEGDFLVVEWADGALGDLPLHWWAGARAAQEGQRVEATLRPARRGARALTAFPATFPLASGTVQVPLPASPGRVYAVCARPSPQPRVGHSSGDMP
jgi:hypothetical protein